MSDVTSILVVGAGQAAAVAVAELRHQGFQGAITVVGEEAHAPYERPPLSKAVLAAVNADEPGLNINEADFFTAKDITLRLGERVVAVDPQAGHAVLSDGAILGFDRCLLATGGKARVLPSFPAQSPVVHYLRTLDDARRLRDQLARSAHVVIVGGGFLGLEVASTARSMGVKVSVIETADRLLSRAAPVVFSDWLQERVARSGTQMYLGQTIQEVDLARENGRLARISLADGTILEADTIVVAVGLTPSTDLARMAGLDVDSANGGILVDEQCRTSVPTVFAAGDCTSQRRAGHAQALRLESWQNANEQARVAASAMLDRTCAPSAYPWFWTDQFGCNVQMLGLPQPGLDYIVRGEADSRSDTPSFVMLGLQDGRPHHALAVNAGGDLRALRPLLERALCIDVAHFTNTDVAVRAFAKTTLAGALVTPAPVR